MILDDIFKLIPPDWSSANYFNKTFTIVPLRDPYSSEYQFIMSKLDGNYYNLISGLYRVQNPLLWAKFLLKKQEYEQRGPVEILTLFHDTAEENLNAICQFNFDWRVGKRFMFGPGVYFSTHPEYAARHSWKTNGSKRAMFIVDVLVQNVQYGNETTFLPDPGHDTVIAHREQTFVKYYDSEYYPRYVGCYEVK